MTNTIKLLIFTLFFTILTAVAPSAYAQSPTTVSSPSSACSTMVWMCPETTDLDKGQIGSHRLKLEASSGLPTTNKNNGLPVDIHIVCGISTDNGDLFTSGNAATDKKLCIGEGTLDKLKAAPYEYKISYSTANPYHSPDGKINTIVHPVTNNVESHSCFLVWELPPDVVDSDGGSANEASGEQNSLKYATFITQGAPAACQSFRADPFGRIFNASTLKPVPNATVSLFDFDSKQLYTLPGVTNPVTTREDGLFNFNIEPGTTFLQSNLTNAALTSVHANSSKAYSNLYTYGSPIVETLQKAEQRDIPVSNGSAPVLKLMDYSNLQFGDETRIEGKASWPLTLVELKQGEQTLMSMDADKFGAFSFMLGNSLIDPTQKITIKLTEVDLTKDTSTPSAGAKTAEKQINPIPRYLEGYAYNKAGQKVPFATVQIKLEMSDQVYYETTADAEAYYSVSPRFLPILPYYIVVIPARVATGGGTTGTGGSQITIPEYAKQNSDYHRQAGINIMAGTRNGAKVDPAAVVSNASSMKSGSNTGGTGGYDSTLPGNRNTSELGKNQGGILQSLQNRRQAGTMMIFILIVLFILIAGGLIVYLKKRGGSNDGMMEPQTSSNKDNVMDDHIDDNDGMI